ncbi:MAG: molybdopterin-dependent oxidoreductase, partial [Chloroflexi bacterium]|nr:molybdopterin-dependent oxidoreductase [Chloroflexota bacterium]
KMVLDYGEELTATFIRTRSYIDLATGATRDGLLTALRARVIFDIGAYNDAFTGYATTYNLVHGPYSIPNIDIDARVVYTNNTPTGHYRAPRAPQQTFAVESHLDGMARRLGIGPLDFRMRNVIKTGHRLAYGGVMGKVGVERTLQAARDFFSQNDAGKIEGEGWGVACAWWDIGAHGGQGPPSSAWVKLNEDGTATLFTGCAEQGGGQHDIMVQIVAEVLTISPESVALVTSDTDAAPFERGTGGSQTTYRAGMSVKLAAEDARRQLIAFAAQKLKVGPEKLETGNGRIFLSGSPEVFVTIASLCAEALTSARGPIMGIGEDLREERVAQSSEEKGLIDGAQTGTHVVKVAVDRETGKIKILKYFASHDAGFVLNRKNVEGQIDGGIVQAAGYALHEELLTENCRTLNPSLKDFRLIRAGDAPAGVEKSIVEVPSEHGPFGARGIGEPPHIPVAAAIANAIYDAVGVRIRDLPLSSSKIVKALKERK